MSSRRRQGRDLPATSLLRSQERLPNGMYTTTMKPYDLKRVAARRPLNRGYSRPLL